jgi:dihydrofolate synthase / folylpolyglutamate synthase
MTAMVVSAESYIESLELFGMQFGLERMHDLLERLGDPQDAFDAIHVVGTNGKSSTVRYCEALLEAEGVHAGAYLSPHITTFRERIRIGGSTIEAGDYDRAVRAVSEAGMEVTQFEALTAAAFVAFARAGVDWAVIEAGLGGRLDATNVLRRSRVQVLTNVSLEHIQLLGDTREKIAAEKLAVVPAGGTVIAGEDGWESLVPDAGSYTVVSVGGSYQNQNRAVAHAAVEAALHRAVAMGPIERLGIEGRLEIRRRDPLEIWDGAHNPAGMQRLVAELPGLLGDRPAVAVFGALADKDVATMISLLRTVCPTIVATNSSNSRSMSADAVARLTGGASAEDPQEALEAARVLAGRGGAVVVCGSLYLLHDLSALHADRGAP